MWREDNKSEEMFTLKKSDFDTEDFHIAMTGDTFNWILINQPHLISYILIKVTALNYNYTVFSVFIH